MQRDDLILISVDDHVIEPSSLFAGRLPKKYEADAPRLVHTDEGTDVWRFRDVTIPNVALNAVAGRPKEEYGMEPQGLDEIRPGCYDVHERVKDMNAGGILAQMNFPSFPGFAARLFATDDPEFSLALVRAYNDWHIDEWCGAYPGRFIPMALPAIWDPEACAAEVRRVADKGCYSLTFTENPVALGYPSFHSDHWDPLWRALSDTGTMLTRYDVPDADTNKITHENAMKWYRFDPFRHVPRDQATVGALRAAAAGHDVSVKGRGHQVISSAEKMAAYRAGFARAAGDG